MRIEEVSEILGLFRLLHPPAHIMIVNEPITNKHELYLGLQPKERSDIIVLGGGSTAETVIHETLHAMGLREEGAGLLARLLVLKFHTSKFVPFLRESPYYRECKGCNEFPSAHSKYASRVMHYRRV